MGRSRRFLASLLGTGCMVALVLFPVGATGAPLPAGTGHWHHVHVTWDETTFLARHPVAVTESFDTPLELPAEQRWAGFGGVSYWSTDEAPPFWTVGGAEGSTEQCPESCRLYRRFSLGTDSTDLVMTFYRRSLVHAVGFVLQPFGTPNQFVLRVIDGDGTVSKVWLPPSSGETYVGLHAWSGIRAVVIDQRPDLVGGAETNFALDDVSRTRLRWPS